MNLIDKIIDREEKKKKIFAEASVRLQAELEALKKEGSVSTDGLVEEGRSLDIDSSPQMCYNRETIVKSNLNRKNNMIEEPKSVEPGAMPAVAEPIQQRPPAEEPRSEEPRSSEKPEEAEFAGDLNMGNMRSLLGSENQGFFAKMSEKGKAIAVKAYEGLSKIPGVDRVVGRLGIAYNQFWIKKHEEKSVAARSKMDSLDLQRRMLNQAKQEISSAIEDLKSQGIPRVESLQLKLKEVDQQQAELLNRKDAAQSQFEARDNKVKLYTNKRDAIADKLIGGFDEKLAPMEKDLERQRGFRDQADLLIAAMEVRHKEPLRKQKKMEGQKDRIAEAYRKTGMDEGAIKRDETVKLLEGMISQGREKIRKEREDLARMRDAIDQRIARTDAKANSYRDKREEFVRAKEGRPLHIEAEARNRGEVFTGREETSYHPRGKAAGEPAESADKETVRRVGDFINETESSGEDEERLTVASFLSQYNEHINTTKLKGNKVLIVDPKDFLRATWMSGDLRLDPEDFKTLLVKYYKLKKTPVDNLNKIIGGFEKKLKAAKGK